MVGETEIKAILSLGLAELGKNKTYVGQQIAPINQRDSTCLKGKFLLDFHLYMHEEQVKVKRVTLLRN